MDIDIFKQHNTGRAALKKLGDVPENFRIYKAGWLGKHPKDFTVMEITGAEFRVAKTGKNAGKLSIIIHGTQRTVYVTKDEINEADEVAA
jgi:hypothetical protein